MHVIIIFIVHLELHINLVVNCVLRTLRLFPTARGAFISLCKLKHKTDHQTAINLHIAES